MRALKHNLLCSNEHKNLPYGQIAKASGSASSYIYLSVTKLQTGFYPWNIVYNAKLRHKRTKQPYFEKRLFLPFSLLKIDWMKAIHKTAKQYLEMALNRIWKLFKDKAMQL